MMALVWLFGMVCFLIALGLCLDAWGKQQERKLNRQPSPPAANPPGLPGQWYGERKTRSYGEPSEPDGK
jgi:hypothetical protein